MFTYSALRRYETVRLGGRRLTAAITPFLFPFSRLSQLHTPFGGATPLQSNDVNAGTGRWTCGTSCGVGKSPCGELPASVAMATSLTI